MKPIEHLNLALELLEKRNMKYNQIRDCIIACQDDLNKEYCNDSGYIFTVNDMIDFGTDLVYLFTKRSFNEETIKELLIHWLKKSE